MKKVKTFKDLQQHPFVSHIDYEYQYGIFDETDYIYLLYLIDGKKFECLDSAIINAPTKQHLVTYFNSYEIISK